MMFDKQLMFSEAQDLSQTAATYNSTNVVDLGASGLAGSGATVSGNQGNGEPISVYCQVVEAFVGSGATVDFRLVSSATSDLGTPTVLKSTGAIAVATLVAGYQPSINGPLPSVTQRYVGILYVIATATTTAGTATAGLLLDRNTSAGTAY